MDNINSLDVLVFAPHPDDAELLCGGLLLKAARAGKKIGVIDVTRGEMGTRGSIQERRREVRAASRLLKLQARENLGLPDGHLHDGERLRTVLVKALRKYRPALLLAPHWEDQHPDHAALGQASIYAAWLAGAPKYDSASARGVAAAGRAPYRPRHILHYNNRFGIHANLVVNISDVIEEKLDLARCYASQFGPGASRGKKSAGEPQTRLSRDGFFDWMRGIHAYYGAQAGVAYGEPYCIKGPLSVANVAVLF